MNNYQGNNGYDVCKVYNRIEKGSSPCRKIIEMSSSTLYFTTNRIIMIAVLFVIVVNFLVNRINLRHNKEM